MSMWSMKILYIRISKQACPVRIHNLLSFYSHFEEKACVILFFQSTYIVTEANVYITTVAVKQFQ